ncbi:hypothetical protein ACUOFC_55330, partial [Escherichia sp. TWPC-MK]
LLLLSPPLFLSWPAQQIPRQLPPHAMADLLAHGRPASDIMQAHLLVVNK